jgi:glycosyltransferase involved in cell wall biosynthesis
MISLIIPSYKNPEYLDLCLKSALENKVNNKTEIIVIIDGFVDMYNNILEKYNNMVNFIEYENNQGMQNAINVGVYQATNKYVFIINEDNVLPFEWDLRLENVINNYKDKGCYTVSQIEPYPSIYDFYCNNNGRNLSEFNYEDFISYEKSLNYNKEIQLNNTGGIFPFIINKKIFMTLGGFDVSYPGPHVCDWDFFMKLEMLGYDTIPMIKNISLYHFGGMSTKRTNELSQFTEREIQSSLYFEFKWGFKPTILNNNNNHYIQNKQILSSRGLE